MSLFSKIKSFFKNMFKIETYVMLPEATEENIIQFPTSEESDTNVIKPNIFDIELLQRKYENNIVSLDELTDEELEMLNDLYVSQIEKLRVIKQDKENQLAEIENKINKKKEVV